MKQDSIARIAQPPKPYARVVRAGGYIHTAGFTGEDPASGVPEDFAAQCALIFGKAERALAEFGASLSDVVSVMVHVTDPGDYKLLDGPFSKVFTDHPPVRTTVVVAALSNPAKRVEMTFVAYHPEGTA